MYDQLQLFRGQRHVGQSVQNANVYQINSQPIHLFLKLRWESFHFPSCCASIKQDRCCAGNVNIKNIYSIQPSSPMSKKNRDNNNNQSSTITTTTTASSCSSSSSSCGRTKTRDYFSSCQPFHHQSVNSDRQPQLI